MPDKLSGRLTPERRLDGTLNNKGTLRGVLGGTGAVVKYASLPDKPSINGVTLVGNKTTSDLNINYNDLKNLPSIPDVGEIDERLDNLEGNITSLGGRVTTAEGNITDLQGNTSALDTRLTTAEGNITSLGGRITTAEGNITSLDGRVTTNEGDILDLQGDMSQAQSDITQLNSSLNDVISSNERNNIGSPVQLDSYTSTNYICPSDGYVRCDCSPGTTAKAIADIFGSTTGVLRMGGWANGTYGMYVCYVKKGMKVRIVTLENSGHVWFYPLV